MNFEQLTSDILLIISAIISLIVILLFRKLNRDSFNKEEIEKNMSKNLNYPYRKFRDTFKGKFKISKLFLTLLILLFMSVSYLFLYVKFGVVVATILFIPSALFLTLFFTEFIWFLAFFIRKLIAIENLKMNTIFSLVITMLVLVFMNLFLFDMSDNIYTFGLTIYNLAFCYFLTVFLSVQLLYEAREINNRTLTLKNVWKSAFLIISLFLIILSGLSYTVFLYDASSFVGINISTYFDFFYYTCVTFATVGFGDITPTSLLARIICVVTIITSILSITILLSTVMSVKNIDDENN